MYGMRKVIYNNNLLDSTLKVVTCAKRDLLIQGVYFPDYEHGVNLCSKCPKVFECTSAL